jgi:exopolyphosphatase / guanosine-5'-triphosphate,3'-diphosphate pyrophosphatase
MWRLHHRGVPVGVVDVGSNTVRLHVAHDGRAIFGKRSLLGLGDAVERFGVIPEPKLDEVGATVAEYVADARDRGAEIVEVLVTSPGRQAVNGHELITRLEDAAAAPVRLLSAADEAKLGFAGALADTRIPPGRRVAVVDVGGGSTQIAVGTRRDGPVWIRSVDLGSMRLTSRCLPDDPPGRAALESARAEVDEYLRDLSPPRPRVAIATGGSARALRRVAGSSRLGPEELEAALDVLAVTPAERLADGYGIELARARTLAAGAVILAGVAQLLGIRFRIGRGGVREGAALELERRRLAA